MFEIITLGQFLKQIVLKTKMQSSVSKQSFKVTGIWALFQEGSTLVAKGAKFTSVVCIHNNLSLKL